LHNPAAGVYVVGEVPDIRPYMKAADAFVIPMRMGSGTRLKALEALASGVPVIATDIGVEGLSVGDRNLVMTAATSQEFAEATMEILRDEQLRQRIVFDGRKYVEQHFQWDSIGADFERILTAVAR
jgi:glycosyltransferase involved in cell wall biosynthesis